MNRNIIIAVIAALIIIGAAVGYNLFKNQKQNSGILPPQKAAEKIVSFINENILKGKALASLKEVVEENGVYKIKIEINGQEIESYATLDGKILFPEAIKTAEAQKSLNAEKKTIGGFSLSDEEICREESKPLVYFFGSENCPFCQWEHPIMEKVAKKFEKEISFHNNMDTELDKDVFKKYSSGGIPTIVLGCRYYRVGAGQREGEEAEEKNLTALICKLTDKKPKDVCAKVDDFINQI